MPAVLLDTLLDEDTSETLAARLSDAGHDVERVVDVEALGEGVDDSAVRTYAEEDGRIIVTHDRGIFEYYHGERGPVRVLWLTEQQRYDPRQKARMVESFLATVGGPVGLSALPPAVPLTPAYLDTDS